MRSLGPTSTEAPKLLHRVLVVDDFPDSAHTIRALLEMNGHQVHTAETGRAGIALAYAFDPTIAIVDLGLPDMNGCDVVRELRSRKGGQRVVIAVLTGWDQPAKRTAALSAGCDRFLVKPASAAKLRELIALADARGAHAGEIAARGSQ